MFTQCTMAGQTLTTLATFFGMAPQDGGMKKRNGRKTQQKKSRTGGKKQQKKTKSRKGGKTQQKKSRKQRK